MGVQPDNECAEALVPPYDIILTIITSPTTTPDGLSMVNVEFVDEPVVVLHVTQLLQMFHKFRRAICPLQIAG